MSQRINQKGAPASLPFGAASRRRALWIFGLLCATSGGAGCKMSSEAAPAVSEASAPGVGAAAKSDGPGQVAAKAGNATRKIVRQAELELEVSAPGTTQTAIERLAEQH